MTTGAAHDDGPWTARALAAAACFVLFLLVQAAVPLVRLTSPRPARFGWQMFSAKHQRTRYTLVLRDGTREPARLATYVANSRGEMDLEEALPRHLCRVVADLESVQVLAPDSELPRVYPCR